MAVKDYNTDPDLNTTISGINIAEGCPPSGINDAIRQLMADVKAEKDAGDDALEAVNDRVDTTNSALATTNSNLATTNSNLATTNSNLATTNSNLAALDAAAVHKTGDETIAGAKTFTGGVTVSGKSKLELSLRQTEVPADVAPSGNKFTIVRFKDAGENSLGALANTVYPTNGVKTYLVAASRVGGENAELEVVAPADGIPYATAPSTPAGSKGNQIVTANYAKDTYLAKSGGTMTGTLSTRGGVELKNTTLNFSPAQETWHEGSIQFTTAAGKRSAFIQPLYCPDGLVVLRFVVSDGTSERYLDWHSTGRLFANGSPVVTLVASWSDGANWYRKYSDGWIEQGGTFSSSPGRTGRTITYQKAFRDTNYTVISGSNEGGAGNGSGGSVYWNNSQVSTRTATTCKIVAACEESIVIAWYACGF